MGPTARAQGPSPTAIGPLVPPEGRCPALAQLSVACLQHAQPQPLALPPGALQPLWLHSRAWRAPPLPGLATRAPAPVRAAVKSQGHGPPCQAPTPEAAAAAEEGPRGRPWAAVCSHSWAQSLPLQLRSRGHGPRAVRRAGEGGHLLRRPEPQGHSVRQPAQLPLGPASWCGEPGGLRPRGSKTGGRY